MSGNRTTNIHVFTDDTLREHDLNIAAKIHQATVVSMTRKLNKMNPGQILNASRKNCKDLYWSQDQLNKVLDHIEDH
jgi:hypothetical protein